MLATSTPQAQPTTARITLDTLKAMLAKGQAAHPDLAGRMDKAARILATRTVEPTGDDGRSWWVASETQAEQFYLVIITPHGAWPCTCKDFERRHDWCKHSLAVALLRRCQEHQEHPEPDPDAPIPYTLTALGEAAARAPEPFTFARCTGECCSRCQYELGEMGE
ncbi:MAG TPA: SWIM zinc finger family protein [Chloroflexota bacterium]|nr:SWIM zinc finger family protein [Chloroflexota bacterium]